MWNMEADNPPGKKYGYGITWLAGNVWNNIGAWAHEMGHNYWLAVSQGGRERVSEILVVLLPSTRDSIRGSILYLDVHTKQYLSATTVWPELAAAVREV
jgi:hypothetical protein